MFKYQIKILEQHLDTFGHVNNATYLQLFEEARWELITQNGFGLSEIQSKGQGPVILGLQMTFKKEIKNRQIITIETQMKEYKGKIGILVQQMRDEDGEVCCSVEMTFGLFDTRARKLIEPTPEWLKAIGQ